MNLFWKRITSTAKFEQEMADLHEDFHSFEKTKTSDLLKEFTDLSEIDFAQAKQQYKQKGEYQASDLYPKEQRFNQLNEDSDIKNYLRYENSHKLDFYKHFEQTISEEFSGNKLNEEEWVNAYRWSNDHINGNYTSEGEYQAYTEGVNTDVIDGELHISTKRKDTEGRIWDKKKGFCTKPFKYTSDLIAGKEHLTDEGCVMVKFKVEGSQRPLQHFIRAYDAKNKRCITLMESLSKRKFVVGRSSIQNGKLVDLHNTIKGVNLQKDFHIIEVEWNKEIVSWKLNGHLIHQESRLIDSRNMHLVIGSRLTGAKGKEGKIVVDYIRYFKRKN